MRNEKELKLIGIIVLIAIMSSRRMNDDKTEMRIARRGVKLVGKKKKKIT